MLHETRGVEFDWLDYSRIYGCRVLNASGEIFNIDSIFQTDNFYIDVIYETLL